MAKTSQNPRKRICMVSTVALGLNVFMKPHISLLSQDHDVVLMVNGSAEDLSGILGQHVSFIPIKIEREISLISDLLCLITLYSLFKKYKFDCVYSILPKSGLLAMLASWFARVPVRLNIFNGQIWENREWWMRRLLIFTDKITARCATHLLAVSPSLRNALIQVNVVSKSQIQVLADGSINGVDIDRFKYSPEICERIREALKIPRDAIVFLFLGRLSQEKGILDLVRAFVRAGQEDERIQLLIVGPDEEGMGTEISSAGKHFLDRIHRSGYTDHPEKYISAANVLCLPSYREGFGKVAVEASSVGLAVMASRINGLVDAVEEGVTGLFHEPRAENQISELMLTLARDESLRTRLGREGRKRVMRKFSQERVMEAFAEYYTKILSSP